MAERQKFDGLAENYDAYRPRYPQELFQLIGHLAPPKHGARIADIGAGTGIALEGLVELYGNAATYIANDISEDMKNVGERKFPAVQWQVGRAEEFLQSATNLDVIVVAQAFQWMDRSEILSATRNSLVAGGVFAVLQNNRDYESSRFLGEYEDLLEEWSPGYTRNYRNFDFKGELDAAFPDVGDLNVYARTKHVMRMRGEAFMGMSASSTQVQRAIAAHGGTFDTRLRDLIAKHESDGVVSIPYVSEIFAAKSNFERPR